jgi:HEAT repeat protein
MILKKDQGKWPKEINGKTIDDCVREMKSNPDPVVRESAVRTLPLYGPLGREKGAEHLVFALTKDPDFNVRMTAMGVAPTVLASYADAPDQPLTDGLTAFMRYLDSDEKHVKYEAVLACSAVGPYMKREKPDVISKLAFRSRDASSWQLRRAAVGALASIGQGTPPTGNSKGIDPDKNAVTALLNVLKDDTCGLVRRSAIDALIMVGPVAAAQQGEWRKILDSRVTSEKEKLNQLWIHALILRNSPSGLKGNEAHLNAIGDALKADDAQTRLEACQAMGLLGEEAVGKLQGLLDLIQDVKQEPAVVAAAMMAASTMKTQAGIIQPVLQNASFANPNQDVKRVAQEAMVALAKK